MESRMREIRTYGLMRGRGNCVEYALLEGDMPSGGKTMEETKRTKNA